MVARQPGHTSFAATSFGTMLVDILLLHDWLLILYFLRVCLGENELAGKGFSEFYTRMLEPRQI